MRRFMSSLNRASNKFSNESTSIRQNEGSLDTRFLGLQNTVRKTLIVKPRLKTGQIYNAHPPHVHKAPPKPPEAEDTLFSHNKNPHKNHAFHAKPTFAASRIYQSPATQKMYEDILYGYADYLDHPTPSGMIQYESQIDPVLHVGTFENDELNQLGTIAPLYDPPPLNQYATY
ncbi:hypothetical protein TRFO_10727 [Tritrichomonas foetus]|uniref:Uncharacterized protein n=1 Tax=Tritrichomonas foetus TaxID=1144522 RepID=A0A1J4JCL7_9EUKA|nr:hypothetical protein TRFO_10727 [Tritrichomonas foetus]|eukprot:OHS95020.1 hypothetical protein TRFO_10727 [Tritrichomonas foetus]